MTSRPFISPRLRRQVAKDANNRCGYCLSAEILSGIPLTIDHIIPVAAGGDTVRENLWLACRPCNEYKSDQIYAQDSETGKRVRLFNPRAQDWHTHFTWSVDGTHILGLTSTGRATVAALKLNRYLLVCARSRWVQAGWHPPALGQS